MGATKFGCAATTNIYFPYAQPAVASGPGYVVPAGGGVVTSWTGEANNGATGGEELMVLRGDLTSAPTVVAVSPPHSMVGLTAGQSFTDQVSIPVQAGDELAIDGTGLGPSCLYSTASNADVVEGYSGSATPLMGGEMLAGGFGLQQKHLDLSATLEQATDLGITQTASAPSVAQGSSVQFSLRASNAGPASTTATVTDTLSSGLTPVLAGANGGTCTIAAQTVTCQLNTIASGGSTTIQVTADATAPGSQTSAGSIYGPLTDPNPVNNSATASVTVVAALVKPTLTGATSVSGTPEVGHTLTCNPPRVSSPGDPATSAFSWLRDGNVIANATDTTYAAILADGGHELACRFTASNSAGSVSALSAAVAVSDTAPSLELASTTVKIDPQTGNGTLSATCDASPGRACTFTGALYGSGRLPAGIASAKPRPKRAQKLATVSGAIAAGHSGKLTVQLTKAGLATLKSKHRLSARLYGKVSGQTASSKLHTTIAIRLKTKHI